jgi:hypothetical protein
MKYNGKDLTVVTVEHLILTFTRHEYYPPKGTAADKIFADSMKYDTKAIFDCIEKHTGQPISWKGL